MKKLFGIFIRGVFTLAPIVLSMYLLYLLYEFTDGLFRGLLQQVGFYFPGLGFLATLVVIFLAGLLASYWFTNKLFGHMDRLFIKIPLLGTIYGIIKDTLSSFSENKNSFARVVRVNLTDGIQLLGFLTNDEESAFIPRGYVAVYVMQSMQWAGTMILVPKELIQPVDASTEDALKFVASAGLLKGKSKEIISS